MIDFDNWMKLKEDATSTADVANFAQPAIQDDKKEKCDKDCDCHCNKKKKKD